MPPGGGFIAGVLTAVAMTFQMMAFHAESFSAGDALEAAPGGDGRAPAGRWHGAWVYVHWLSVSDQRDRPLYFSVAR